MKRERADDPVARRVVRVYKDVKRFSTVLRRVLRQVVLVVTHVVILPPLFLRLQK